MAQKLWCFKNVYLIFLCHLISAFTDFASKKLVVCLWWLNLFWSEINSPKTELNGNLLFFYWSYELLDTKCQFSLTNRRKCLLPIFKNNATLSKSANKQNSSPNCSFSRNNLLCYTFIKSCEFFELGNHGLCGFLFPFFDSLGAFIIKSWLQLFF